MTASPPTSTKARGRALQVVTALTAVLLAGALGRGFMAGGPDAGPAASAGGHHGTVPAPSPPTTAATAAPADAPADAPAGHATTAPSSASSSAPGTTVGADGRVVHDHGDLEVTVMLGEDGQTRVQGPVRPGASISFVNHTTADQVLTSADGTTTVDVPLVRLVTVRAPTTPGTYRLVSGTDSTVAAELVVAP